MGAPTATRHCGAYVLDLTCIEQPFVGYEVVISHLGNERFRCCASYPPDWELVRDQDDPDAFDLIASGCVGYYARVSSDFDATLATRSDSTWLVTREATAS